MKRPVVGYIPWPETIAVSVSQINDAVERQIGCVADLRRMEMSAGETLEDVLRRVEPGSLDYLYVESFEHLFVSFLVRERLEIDLPFIFHIHSVYYLFEELALVLPLVRVTDLPLAPSRHAARMLQRICPYVRARVIPFSLDLRQIRRWLTPPPRRRDHELVFLGRLTESKGIVDLLRAMPAVKRAVPDVLLNVIGPANQEAFLPDVVDQLGIAKAVRFCGVRTHKSKYRILASAAILVNPTRAWGETFSMVNIEAFAAGTPVIASRWAAVPESVRHGYNGFLVDAGSTSVKRSDFVAGLADAIIRLLLDKKARQRLSSSARNAAAMFDCRTVSARLAGWLRARNKKRANAIGWQRLRRLTVHSFSDRFNRECSLYMRVHRGMLSHTYGQLYDLISSHQGIVRPASPRGGSSDNCGRERTIRGLFKSFLFVDGKVSRH